MTTWARIINNDLIAEVTEIDPKDRFHSDIIWSIVPEGTKQNATLINGVWTNPVPPPVVVPSPPPPPGIGTTTPSPAIVFTLLTLQENIDLRASTDLGVLAWLRIVDDLRLTEVNLTTPPVIQAVNYLTTIAVPNTVPSRTILTADRPAHILAGFYP